MSKESQLSLVENKGFGMPSLSLAAAQARQRYRLENPERVYVQSVGEKDHERPVSSVGDQWVEIVTEEGRGKIPLMASASLETPPATIKQVFILPPGITRNGPAYYERFMTALENNFSEEERATMLVISPQFLHKIDIGAHNLPPDTLHWGYHEWKSGEPAVNTDAPISSYAALDSILLGVKEKLPNLTTVTLVGHSAGAQMLDRYTFTGKALTTLEEQGVKTRSILANPGTVLYFSPERPEKNAEENYSLKLIDPKSSLHDWPYGINNPPPYVYESLKQTPFKDALHNFLQRAHFAIGSQDNDPNGAQVQSEIEALAQGVTRFDRVVGHDMYLNSLRLKPDEQRLFLVEGVAHNIGQIFSDPAIVSFLRTPDAPYVRHLWSSSALAS